MAIEKIGISNSYLRLDSDVSELEKSIQAVGVIAPLIVNSEGKLLAGGRRYQALSNLGYRQVPVVEVDLDEYQQELISIDENVVRQDLHKLEFEANIARAKELYTEILKQDSSKQAAAKEQLLQFESDIDSSELDSVERIASESFVHNLREKTGLSANQIYQAIRRDERSSVAVKDARNNGQLSITHTNELIKLEPAEQEKILPLISEKSVAELKKIVKESKTNGIKAAIALAKESKPHAREIEQIERMLTRILKNVNLLSTEGVSIEGALREKLEQRWQELQGVMQSIL